MDQIVTENVALKVADGSTMNAYVARPSHAGKHPGIIVFQEAFGVNAHIRDVAGRFAKIGVTAIAPELFHRTAAGFEAPYTDFPSTIPHMQAMSYEGNIEDARAAYEFLRNDPAVQPARIASIGFCMGGRVSFLACTIAAAGGDFVLRRKHCAGFVAASTAAECADFILLGREG